MPKHDGVEPSCGLFPRTDCCRSRGYGIATTVYNDGIIVATVTSGLTPPLTFTYYDGNWVSTIHSNVNAMNDTLFNAPYISYVQVTDGSGAWGYVSPTSMVPPFTVDWPEVTPAICPALGSAAITINNGGSPASVDWYDVTWPITPPGTFVGNGNPMNLATGTYSAIVTVTLDLSEWHG